MLGVVLGVGSGERASVREAVLHPLPSNSVHCGEWLAIVAVADQVKSKTRYLMSVVRVKGSAN